VNLVVAIQCSALYINMEVWNTSSSPIHWPDNHDKNNPACSAMRVTSQGF